jgi:hypothetical protein
LSGQAGKPLPPASAALQAAIPVSEDAPPPNVPGAAVPAAAAIPKDVVEATQQARRRKADLFETEEVRDKRANRQLRDIYAAKAYELAAECIHFWIFLILANGLIAAMLGKQVISDTALIAITTGVTVNVLAAFLGVIRGLFPTEKASKTESLEKSEVSKK